MYRRLFSLVLAVIVFTSYILTSSVGVFADTKITNVSDGLKDVSPDDAIRTINNSAPAAGLSFARKNKVDLVFGIGKTVNNDVNQLTSKINNIVVPKLQSGNLDVQISVKKTSVFSYGKVFAGNGNSAALSSDGSVYIWGSNDTGQLGTGARDDNNHALPYKALSGCTDLSLGSGHVMALSANGTVYTWGNGSYYQLGDPSNGTFSRYSPSPVLGLSEIADVEAGRYSSYAIKSDGTVYSWGYNIYGECGVGSAATYITSPTKIEGLTNVNAISGGLYYAAALLNDGTVYTWGLNHRGQLGDGTTQNKNKPTRVEGLSGVVAISIGDYHCLALKSDGTVWVWGDNSYGEYGNGTTQSSLTPIKIPGLAGVTSVTAGGNFHSLALLGNGTVYGWGYNGYKQIINSGSTTINTPVQIPGLTGVKDISAGQLHSLCTKEDGTVWGWGTPRYGSLGFESYATSPVCMEYTAGFKQVATGYSHTVALKEDGTVWVYGSNDYGQLGLGYINSDRWNYDVKFKQIPGLSDVVAVYAEGDTCWALKSDGNLWGWGRNYNFQIGDGTTVDRYSPTKATLVSNVKDMDAYQGYVFVLRKDGSTASWGSWIPTTNGFTQYDTTDIVDVAYSNSTYHVLNSRGELWSWGYNASGQIGDGTNKSYTFDQRKLGLTNIREIAANRDTVLAITNNNELYVCGLSNRSYEWGIPTYSNFTLELTSCKTAEVYNCVNGAVAGAYNTLYMSGYDFYNNTMGGGQLSVPTQFKLNNIKQMSLGNNFSNFVCYDGTVWQIYSGRSFYQIPDGSLFKISGESNEELKDTLASSIWRPDAKHVFINVSDQVLADLNDTNKLAAAINTLSNNSIEYVTLGSSANQAQALSLITSNGGNGEFYDNTNIDNALSNAAGYVVDCFKPRADVYINIGNIAQNNISTVTGLINNTLLPALKSLGLNAKATVNNGTGQTIAQVLDTIPWRSSSARFFVNISDASSTELNTLENTLIPRQIQYCGFGTGVNEAQINNLVIRNNGKGLYFNNTNLSDAMSKLSTYIDSQIDRTAAYSYVLVGDAITYHAFYNDAENDPRLDARWKYVHDPYYFDNSNGIIPDSGDYRPFSYTSFDKVGKYTVSYQVKDNPKIGAAFDEYKLWSDDTVFKTVILVHRKPIAQFNAVVSYNSSLGYYVPTITDSSYDLDHTSRPDKGITSKAYQWKEINDAIWKDGLPSSMAANKVYLIKLVVTDLENAQSDPCIKTINTGSGNNPPVAQFVLSPNPVKLNQNAVITDTSYDPDGDPIVERVWTLIKGNTVLFTGATAPVSYSTWGSGDYTMKLKVKDSWGAWSNEYSQDFSVIIDSLPPVISITPTERDWSNTNVTVTVSAFDVDSGIKEVKYCWTNSPDKPASGWLSSATGNFTSTQSAYGIWYFHAVAYDKSILNNSAYASGGAYKIDKIAPVGTVSITPSTWTNGNVIVNIAATDEGSGVKRIQLPSGSWITGDSTEYTVSANGTYNFTIEDNAGNTKVVPAVVTNIDKLAPTGVYTPNTRSWANTDVNVVFVPSDTGGSGVSRCRYRLSNDGGTTWGTWSDYTEGATNRTISLDTDGIWKIQSEIYDNAGNMGIAESGLYYIDKTFPSGTYIPDKKNWTNNNVSVIFDPSDTGGSGVYRWRYRTSSDNGATWSTWNGYIVGDTNGSINVAAQGVWVIQAEVADNAGNIAVVSSGAYLIDKDNPSGIFTPNNQSWTNSNVTTTFIPSDTGGSGVYRWRYKTSSDNGTTWGSWSAYTIGETSGSISLTSQGIWAIQTEVADNAGNMATVISGTYYIDKTAPSGTFAPNSQSWTNNNVTVTFNPSDSGGSGVKQWRYRTSSNNGTTWGVWSAYTNGSISGNINLTAQGTWLIQVDISDNAGNTATVTSGTYYIDKTAPSGVFNPNSQSWTNSNVTVTFNPSDAGGSGVKQWRYRTSSDNGTTWGSWSAYTNGATSGIINLTSQGGWLIQAEVSDNAGNMATVTSGSYNIDKTAPAGTFTPNNQSWTNSNVTVTFNPSDAGGSGVKQWRYRTSSDGGTTWGSRSVYTNGAVSGNISLATQGTWLIQVDISDNAGNTATVSSGTYYIDKTAPSGVFTPNSQSWTNASVTVTFAPSDAGGSGVYRWRYRTSSNNGSTWGLWSAYTNGAANGTITLATEGLWLIESEVTDAAGNVALVGSGLYRIDQTPPSGSFVPGFSGWTNSNLTVVFTPDDQGGSGVYRWRYRTSSNSGTTWSSWSAYTNGSASGNINFTSQGVWLIQVDISDNAGNTATLSSFEYQIDKTLPGGTFTPNSCTWTNQNVLVSFAPSDTGGSGVKQWRYRNSFDNGSTWGTWSSYIIGNTTDIVNLTGQGLRKLQVEVSDNAGNIATLTSGTYQIDTTAPTVDCTPVSRDWGNTEVIAAISASDPENNLLDVKYCWSASSAKPDSGWISTTSGSFIVTLGITGVFYLHMEARDVAGNTSYRCRGPYRVDMIAPGISCSPASLETSQSPVTANISAHDAHSGVKYIRYMWSTSATRPDTGWQTTTMTSFTTSLYARNETYYLHLEVADNAGNTLYRCVGPYRIILNAFDFTITSILDIAWRGYYFDLNNPINGNGDIYGYPKRSGTDIKTDVLPINSSSLIPYGVKSVKAGYKVKGYVKIDGEPESVSLTARYRVGGKNAAAVINTVKSGICYSFEWIIPLNTDDNTYVSFDITAIKDGSACGNEIWSDSWHEGNSGKRVLYIKGNAMQDLQYIQSN